MNQFFFVQVHAINMTKIKKKNSPTLLALVAIHSQLSSFDLSPRTEEISECCISIIFLYYFKLLLTYTLIQNTLTSTSHTQQCELKDFIRTRNLSSFISSLKSHTSNIY